MNEEHILKALMLSEDEHDEYLFKRLIAKIKADAWEGGMKASDLLWCHIIPPCGDCEGCATVPANPYKEETK